MTSILLTNPQLLQRWRRLRRKWPPLPPPHGMSFSDWRSSKDGILAGYTREVCSGNIPGKMNPLLPSFSVSPTAEKSLNASSSSLSSWDHVKKKRRDNVTVDELI